MKVGPGTGTGLVPLMTLLLSVVTTDYSCCCALCSFYEYYAHSSIALQSSSLPLSPARERQERQSRMFDGYFIHENMYLTLSGRYSVILKNKNN